MRSRIPSQEACVNRLSRSLGTVRIAHLQRCFGFLHELLRGLSGAQQTEFGISSTGSGNAFATTGLPAASN
jgi:hypothetical protein